MLNKEGKEVKYYAAGSVRDVWNDVTKLRLHSAKISPSPLPRRH